MTYRCMFCRVPLTPNEYRVCAGCGAANQSLFGPAPHPRHRSADPLPARHAAHGNHAARVTQKKEILQRLDRSVLPLTARDLRDITDGQQNRVSKRLGELVDDGLVREHSYEQGPHGRLLTRYVITDEGRQDIAMLAGGR